MNSPRLHRCACFVVGLMLAGLTACAAGPRLENHTFEFDARFESPDAEVVDYKYGNSKQPSASNPDYIHKEGRSLQFTGITGEMLRGDFLNVKWRIKSTGEVFEKTVDLTNRLPAEITNHRIHFVVNGQQLYVYLITPEKLQPNPCPSQEERRRLAQTAPPEDRVFRMYCSFKILTVYPDPFKD